MTVTRDGEWSIDGFTIGTGTVYPVESVEGLGVPEVRTQDREFEAQDGAYGGQDYTVSRELVFKVGVDGDPDSSGYGAAIDALTAVWLRRSSDVVAMYRRFGRNRRFYGRPRGIILPWDDDFHLGAAHATARFVCNDPRSYDETETSVTLSSPGPVTNSGGYPTYPVITMAVTSGSATIVNLTNGARTLNLTGASGLTCVFNAKARSLTVGGASRYDLVDPSSSESDWSLLPGANSITFGGMSAPTIVYRNAWNAG